MGYEIPLFARLLRENSVEIVSKREFLLGLAFPVSTNRREPSWI